MGRSASAEPWREKELDLDATFRLLEPVSDILSFDDEEGGKLLDGVTAKKVGSLVFLDSVQGEGFVVSPRLQERTRRSCAPVIFSVVALPLTYLPILLVANDHAYLGANVNGKLANFLGGLYFVLILAIAVAAI